MNQASANVRKGIIAIVVLTAAIALANVMARFLDSGGFTILQQVYLRVFVALALTLLLFSKHLRWHVIRKLPAKEWGVLAFRGLTGYALGVTLISQASTMTTISNVTFIASLPLVPLLGFILLKEKVTWWKLLFVLGSFFGVALLAIKDWSNLLAWDAGDIVAVIATLGLALTYISRKWHNGMLNNYEITSLTFVFGFLSVLFLSIGFGEGMPTVSSWIVWLGLIFAGSLSMIKMLMTNYGFQHLSAVQSGNLLTLEGAWGVLFGWLFYSEVPSLQGLAGGLLIIGCVVGMNFFAKHGEAKIPPSPEAHVPLKNP